MTNLTNETIGSDVVGWLQTPDQWPLVAAESLACGMYKGREHELVDAVIKAAFVVHRELGPGQRKSVYEACLAYELTDRGIWVERQKAMAVQYRNAKVECDYRIDLVVSDEVVVELRSGARIEVEDEDRLRSCLRVSGYKVGLLINFDVIVLPNGIRKVVNEWHL